MAHQPGDGRDRAHHVRDGPRAPAQAAAHEVRRNALGQQRRVADAADQGPGAEARRGGGGEVSRARLEIHPDTGQLAVVWPLYLDSPGEANEMWHGVIDSYGNPVRVTKSRLQGEGVGQNLERVERPVYGWKDASGLYYRIDPSAK